MASKAVVNWTKLIHEECTSDCESSDEPDARRHIPPLSMHSQQKHVLNDGDSCSKETTSTAVLPKIPESIRFSDILRGKRYGQQVLDLEKDLGYLYTNFYSQNRWTLYEYMEYRFQYWKEH